MITHEEELYKRVTMFVRETASESARKNKLNHTTRRKKEAT